MNQKIFNLYIVLGSMLITGVIPSPAARATTAVGMPQPVQPKKTLYQHSNLSAVNYQSYLKEHSQYESPISQWEVTHLSSQLSSQLKQNLKLAQHHFLNKSLARAKSEFNKIIQLSTLAHWEQAQKEAIFYSYFRLAQLSSSPLLGDKWIRKAIFFAPELAPDTNIFPPPLIHRHQSIKKSQTWLNWSPFDHFNHFDRIIINGMSYPIDETTKIPLSLHKVRITVLSNRYQPTTAILNGQQILTWSSLKRAYLSGSCKNPLIQLKADDRPRSLDSETGLFPEFCLATKPIFQPKKFQLSHLLPKNRVIKSKQPGPMNEVPPNILTKTANAQTTRWYKKKWVWIGAGILATGIYFHNQSNRQSRFNDTPPPPSPQEGY